MTHNYQQLIIKFTSWGPAPAQCSALSPSALSSQLSTLVFLSQLCRVQRWRLLAPAPALSWILGIILITSPVKHHLKVVIITIPLNMFAVLRDNKSCPHGLVNFDTDVSFTISAWIKVQRIMTIVTKITDFKSF